MMHRLRSFWLGLLLFVSHEGVASYTYPVALLPCNNSVIYMMQGISKNSLISFDIHTRIKEPLLSCQYSPYHVSVLKSGDGFSFVDSDLLYIKQCAVRSPRVVDFGRELYGIGPVTWIDAARGYFSAMLGHWMGIFEVDIKNNDATKELVWQQDIDCYAPHKGNEYLFYVTRTVQKGESHFCIQRSVYASPSLQECVYQSSSVVIQLDVVSDDELFFVTCAPNKSDPDLIICWYHHLSNKEGAWCSENLFTFLIPGMFLSSPPEGLYDCFALFMPRRHENRIFFVSQDESEWLDLFYYDTTTKHVSLIKQVDSVFQQQFVPLLIGNELFYGGKTIS